MRWNTDSRIVFFLYVIIFVVESGTNLDLNRLESIHFFFFQFVIGNRCISGLILTINIFHRTGLRTINNLKDMFLYYLLERKFFITFISFSNLVNIESSKVTRSGKECLSSFKFNNLLLNFELIVLK